MNFLLVIISYYWV